MKTKVTLSTILLMQLVFLFFGASAQQRVKRTSTNSTIPYLEHLPPGYALAENQSESYPVLIFLHGSGEQGDGSDTQVWKVAKHGPPQHIRKGHDMTFEVDGQSHSFIVISPQLLYSAGGWSDSYIDEVVQHVRRNYRVDDTRIYLTGLSLGGGGVWRFGGKNADLFAAIAPVCAAQSVMHNLASNMSDHDLPVWAFHGDADNTISVEKTIGWVNALRAADTDPDPKMTIYPGVGHNSWTQAYNTTHTYHQPNLYEWLLSHTRGEAAPQPDPAPAPAPPAPSTDVNNCGCDYTVPSGQYLIDGKALGTQPGDVICLKSGTNYKSLKFVNLQGSASAPITIRNCGGKVTINTTAPVAIKVYASKHFRVTGSGDSRYPYGIELRGAATVGLSLGELSTEFEVDRLEVHSIGFAGIMAKTDPKCGKPYDRSKFTMRNIRIHDNYIHDTQGEGLYIGNSFYAKGMNTSCGRLLPHEIHNAKVYNNVVKRTGWDGIQVGAATEGCEVYNNTIEDYGRLQNSVHGNGIQLGEGTGGKCYNNMIKNGHGNGSGIIALGLGDNVIFNNVIVNPGKFGTFIDSRPPASPGDGFKFVNNTIINASSDGVRIYADDSHLQNQVKNNIIVAQGDYVRLLHSGITNTTITANFGARSVSEVNFANASEGDYHLTTASSCLDQGVDLSAYGVTFDIENTERPSGGAFDIGACERLADSNPAPAPAPAPADSSGHGLNYSYYEGSWDQLPDFGSLTAEKTGIVANFSLSPRTADDNFGFLFEGYIDITTAGMYTFYTTSDDGSALYINDQQVVDNDDLHAPRESSGRVYLDQGKHHIRVTFFEKSVGQTLKVHYAGPGIEKIAIPEEVLFREDDTASPATPEEPTNEDQFINYSYYEGEWSTLPNFWELTPVATGQVSNFDLSVRQQDSNFGVVYEGHIAIPASGSYTFLLNSDDGSKLYIGGFDESNLVVNNDGLHAASFKKGTVSLEAGTHPITVTFFERGGQEVLEVYWENTAHGVTERTLIPNEAFVLADDSSPLPEEPAATEGQTVYVNFGNSNSLATAPWNNLIGTTAGTQLSNLQDQEGVASELSVSLLDTWGGNKSQSISGATTYPKAVAGSYHWDASPNEKRIKLTGMNPESTYSLSFFAGRTGSGNKTTVYTVNGSSVSLNASNNLVDTVFLDQIVPDAQGEIVVGVRKADGASYGYLNGLVIREATAGSEAAQRTLATGKKAYAAEQSAAATADPVVTSYPNPIADQLTVDLFLADDADRVHLQLATMLGTSVASSSIATVRPGKSTVTLNNLSDLKSGIYVLSVSVDNTPTKTIRLVKN